MAELDPPTIVLLGNYALDRQESMLRFRNLLSEQLASRHYDLELISPEICLGRFLLNSRFNKWLAYVDKYILFPFSIWLKLTSIRRTRSRRQIIVHICDHSNAVYVGIARWWSSVLVTCHDLLAVRGALGEDTDCPATGLGKFLQKAILRGLRQADNVACVSSSTQSDLMRLTGNNSSIHSEIVPLALNYPYRPIAMEETVQIFKKAQLDLNPSGFILHVGSGLRRKNREALLKAVASVKDNWGGKIVFAGLPLEPIDRDLAQSLKLQQRIVEIKNPSNELLLALYNGAHALVFMSRFEGFGWPVLEAQASGCPVICSNRTSLPEVAGDAALICDPEDHLAVGKNLLHLQEPSFRQALVDKGLKNVQRFTVERMIQGYQDIYANLQKAE